MFHVKHQNDSEIAEMSKILNGWGIDLPEEARRKFAVYRDILLQWNRKVHLVSKGDEKKIVQKHFIESLVLLKLADFSKRKRMMDLGAGAGFPSVPLKILFPGINLLLVETNRKKSLFLEDKNMLDVSS